MLENYFIVLEQIIFIIYFLLYLHIHLHYNIKIMYIIILILLVLVICWVGYLNYQAMYYILVGLGLLPLAYFIRKLDTMPLIFAFLVHDRMIDAGNRLISLYW